ncbi:hypothetical protein LR48_Vigan10g126200 [Vigna angularis]|uniref:Uncharacterized protein n=1 Tax=Phaseolus angularis TaxID=3914 RepID=A0A0L9VJZ0_PHAAN|nr:hypothetical protein LR48_Vigan10g126200 [Vigna angularis]
MPCWFPGFEYKGVDVLTEAFQSTHPGNKIDSSGHLQMGLVLQGNTYVHHDDVGNPNDKDDDEEMVDVPDEAGSFAPASPNQSYSLESLPRQLSNMYLLQASRHEEVCSLLRGLDDRVHTLEGLVQPLDADDSDE